jgi:hypothetical protein
MAVGISHNAVSAYSLSKTEAAALTEAVADLDLTIPRGDVTATLNFYKAPEDGSIPFDYVEMPPEGQPQKNYGHIPTQVTIHDIRGHLDEYNLDKDAFTVIQNVPESTEKEFISDESIKKNYYPEVEKLLLQHIPGSHKVVIFNHIIRRPPPPNQDVQGGGRFHVLFTHIDHTAKAAKERVQLDTGEEAEELLKGRYRIINVWRPLNGPVVDTPLCFASSASVDAKDIIHVEHRYPDRIGQTAAVRHNEGQKWHYLSGMKNDERLLLEIFDSEALREGSYLKGGRVPHSGFEDPRTPVGASRRLSIEVRTLVFG